MKIAMFTGSMRGGGAEHVMLQLATSFADRSHDVDIVLARATGEYLRMVPDSVRVVDLKDTGIVTFIRDFLRYARRERPAVVVATGERCELAALIAKLILGRRLRVIIQRGSMWSPNLSAKPSRYRVELRLTALMLPLADGVVAASDGVADVVRALSPRAAHKVTTIYSPIDTANIALWATDPVDHPWFGYGNAPVILTAGRLVAPKDYATLLRAFAAVERWRPARLMILGEGPERENLLALRASLRIEDHVELPGFEVNPFKYMARSSVFVLSSRYEGLPTMLIEAMACGTPVVSTDCPGGPDEILEGGRWGRLVPVGDWQAMARAIEATLDDPMPAGVLKARAAAFSVDASVDRYLALLRKGAL